MELKSLVTLCQGCIRPCPACVCVCLSVCLYVCISYHQGIYLSIANGRDANLVLTFIRVPLWWINLLGKTKANVVILHISPENEKRNKQIETQKENNKTKANKTNKLHSFFRRTSKIGPKACCS